MDDGTEQPVATSWGKAHESQSSFFHEKTPHDGTSQSIVNEIIPRDRPGQPVVIPGGQSSSSFVPSVIKTNVLLNSDDPAHKKNLLQRYGERIENLSQQDRLSKFCKDAGFLNVVEIGQYFMTKDTGDLTQFNTVALS